MRSFFLLFFSVYFGATAFVSWHMMDVLKPFKVKYILLVIYIVLGLAVFLGRFWGKHLPLEMSAFLTRLGYIWMSLLTYMFVWSVVWLVLRLFKVGPVLDTHRILFFFGEVALCLIIFLIGYINAYDVRVVTHHLETEKSTSLRVVQISDVHLGFMNSERQFEKVVNKINSLEPDILLITGDFIENEHNYAVKKGIGQSIKNINPPLGKWAVTGNHEYIAGIETSMEYMNGLGIKVLRDSSVLIDDGLLLIGREDRSMRRWAEVSPLSLDEVLSQNITSTEVSALQTAKEALTILMTHQVSDHFEYMDKNIDLVVSGHTHFGQLFPFTIVTKKMFDIAYGLEKRGNTYMYVSSGTGVWGPPFRMGTISEIIVFEISSANLRLARR